MSDRADIERIRSHHPLEAYLPARGIDVTRRGRIFKALCPFHPDKSPSLDIDPEKQVWICRAGCGGGSVLDFVMKLDGIGFKEAFEKLGGEGSSSTEHPPRRPRPTPPRPPRVEIDRLLADHAFPHFRELWWEESDPRPGEDPADDWRLMLETLYSSNDVLWLGEPKESGQPCHARNFRTRDEWLACPTRPAGRMAPGVFKPGSVSRCKEQLAASPYLIIESDELRSDPQSNKAASAALFQWLRKCGLKLAAVIDTGRRSLHGWFVRPDPQTLADLTLRAPSLCIDTTVLDHGPSSPLRLPGCVHQKTGQPATLLFLSRP